MRNNLGPAFARTYHIVIAPFPVYTPVAVTESNTYVGRFRVLGNVYRQLTVEPDDEIHNLPGGVFLLPRQSDIGIPIRLTLPDRHIFEHGRADSENWPLAKLSPTEQSRSVTYKSETPFLSSQQLRALNAVNIGGTIDWLAP